MRHSLDHIAGTSEKRSWHVRPRDFCVDTEPALIGDTFDRLRSFRLPIRASPELSSNAVRPRSTKRSLLADRMLSFAQAQRFKRPRAVD